MSAETFDAGLIPQRGLYLLHEALFAAERLQREGLPVTPILVERELQSLTPPPPLADVEALLESIPFQASMASRGISFAPTQRVSAEQAAAAAIYFDSTARTSHASRLKAAGVSSQQWEGWLRQPAFAEYIRDMSEDRLASALPLAMMRLHDAVDVGKEWAVKLALEATGRHNPRQGGEDVNAVFMAVFETLDSAGVPSAVLREVGETLRAKMLGSAPMSSRRQQTPQPVTQIVSNSQPQPQPQPQTYDQGYPPATPTAPAPPVD